LRAYSCGDILPGMTKLLTAVLAISLAGCAASLQRRVDMQMRSYLDRPVTEVIAQWGPPSTTYDEAPYKVYVWRDGRTVGGGSHSQPHYNYNTHVWETQQVSSPVRTINTYRMYWITSGGLCARYQFGRQ
jgi:hypothetical protein